tara:strand:- start:8956 stop:10080 length:1125 start_codon:yes stop_codon:yes gene_type:complete
MFRDLFIRISPVSFSRKKYGYAFLVHAREISDIYRKYPFLRIFPKAFVAGIAKRMWPVVISKVTGLRSKKTGEEVQGLVIGVIITAQQMMEDRELALKKIIDSATLAKKMGVEIVGLGGLMSSLSKGGLDIVDQVDINVTTGHAYTAFTVASNVFKMTETFGFSKENMKVAIVGASGSVGSTTGQLLAREGYKNIHLVEVARKTDRLTPVIETLKKVGPGVKVTKDSDMNSIKDADIIVTATNAPDAVVNSNHLKKGAIIVDDAQPSDVAPEVLDNYDVLVLEAGAVHTPGVDNHFNFGLKDKYDNFCCMCEIMVLAANEWKGNYVVNRADLPLIDSIIEMSEGLGFELSKPQNFKEIISEEHLKNIQKIINQR